MCPAQLTGPSIAQFFLTLTPSDKSSTEAREHQPPHPWGGSDGSFQAHPSQKILKWDLFLKTHNPVSLWRPKQKTQFSAGVMGGERLYRHLGHTEALFSPFSFRPQSSS